MGIRPVTVAMNLTINIVSAHNPLKLGESELAARIARNLKRMTFVFALDPFDAFELGHP